MQVIASDGGMVGHVEAPEGERIRVTSAARPGSGYHSIPAEWVVRVDEHVHLDREAALVRDQWTTKAAAAAVHSTTQPEAPSHRRPPRWIPWAVGFAGLAIILILAIFAFAYGFGVEEGTPLPTDEATMEGESVSED